MLLALLARERDQRTLQAAVATWATVRFLARAADLHMPSPEGEPVAVLVELADAENTSSLEHALAMFRQRAPKVPVCAYIPLGAEMVRKAVQLAVRGLVTDVIIRDVADLRVPLRQLLRHAQMRDETAALRRVWRRWTPREVWDIVAACIAVSDGPASVNALAHQLNRSRRTLERQMVRAGLPPPHRVLRWSRLLRAAFRLEQPGANIKRIAAELGYPSSHALAQRLHRHAGLTLTELRTGGFRGLAAHVQTRLLAVHTRARIRGR